MEKTLSEIVVAFEDIRGELLELGAPIRHESIYLTAAILTLARELNFLRQDLEENRS